MKIICTQENLSRGLNIVSQAIGTDTTLPVLANVLLQTEDGRLKLSATDLETGISIFIGGKVEKTGTITVPAKLLAEYIKSLPAEKVELFTKDNILTLTAGSYTASLNGIDPEEFPLIPKIDDKEICTVPADLFAEGINRTAFAAANDESRPELAGVFISFEEKTINLAATDSYRLAESIVTGAVRKGKKQTAIIPAKTLLELNHIIGEQADGQLKISLSENQMMFQYGNASLITRLVEGQFPNYKEIIPDSFQTEGLFKREELLQNIKITGLFSKIGANDIKFEFNIPAKETSLYAASSQVGKNNSKIKGGIKGETTQSIFNYRYLLDGLNGIKSAEVKFNTNGSSGPGIIQPADSKNYTYVVMPIKQ
jgi:DNA polymerase III subunit beta